MTLTFRTVVLSAAMAAAAGLMGSFAIMRRVALASDAVRRRPGT